VSGYPQGATVKFTGGLGRGADDAATLHVGIVNGPVQWVGGGAYVPVHVREINHNLVVASVNIVEVVRP
jgi:hypothetical protein